MNQHQLLSLCLAYWLVYEVIIGFKWQVWSHSFVSAKRIILSQTFWQHACVSLSQRNILNAFYDLLLYIDIYYGIIDLTTVITNWICSV